jgi:hypothetical protein
VEFRLFRRKDAGGNGEASRVPMTKTDDGPPLGSVLSRYFNTNGGIVAATLS